MERPKGRGGGRGETAGRRLSLGARTGRGTHPFTPVPHKYPSASSKTPELISLRQYTHALVSCPPQRVSPYHREVPRAFHDLHPLSLDSWALARVVCTEADFSHYVHCPSGAGIKVGVAFEVRLVCSAFERDINGDSDRIHLSFSFPLTPSNKPCCHSQLSTLVHDAHISRNTIHHTFAYHVKLASLLGWRLP